MVSPAEVATSQEPLSDEEVVTRVLAGETAMFEIVMRRNPPHRARYSAQRGEAEDVMREPTCARTNIWTSSPGGRSSPPG
jgi:hypothetical protein